MAVAAALLRSHIIAENRQTKFDSGKPQLGLATKNAGFLHPPAGVPFHEGHREGVQMSSLFISVGDAARLLAGPLASEGDVDAFKGLLLSHIEGGSLVVDKMVRQGVIMYFGQPEQWRLPRTTFNLWCKSNGFIADGLDVDRNLASSAAVTSNLAQTEVVTEPERRLARLREMGGTAKYLRGEWKFTGIGVLALAEKRDGRKRVSEKTIRRDLEAAAQAEREAKRAGPFAGLSSQP